MDPDDLVIRAARADEAETLSHMIFRAITYWDYPRELTDHWLESGKLGITPEEIENDPTYVAEDEEELEVLGFYSMRMREKSCELKHLFVAPEFLGSDIRSMLFLHACEVAETAGAEYMRMTADFHLSSFYEEMGAEIVGEEREPSPHGPRTLKIFRLPL